MNLRSSSSDRKCLILLVAASLSFLRSSCVAECVTERGAGWAGTRYQKVGYHSKLCITFVVYHSKLCTCIMKWAVYYSIMMYYVGSISQ